MQADNLVFQLILNIGLLALVANLLSKLRIIQNIILQKCQESGAFITGVCRNYYIVYIYKH